MNALQAHAVLNDLRRESPVQQPPWLQSLRGHALDSLCRLGFPSRKQEDWKYTDVQGFLKADYQPQRMSCIGLLPEDIEHLFIADGDVVRAVFVNGWFTPQLSRFPAPASGVDIASLAQVLAQRPQQLQGQLGNTANNEAHGFNAMNTAALNDGLYLHVAEGIRADTAIHLLYLTTASDGLLSLPRNLIRLDAGARAVVIEHYASLGEARTLTDTVSEIVLGEEAALDVYCLQMESMASVHIASQYVDQKRGSKLTSTLVSLGGGLVRRDLTTRLLGSEAECRLNGLYIASGQQHMDFHTCIEHSAPHCTSRQNYRGVLDDRARGVFNGRVLVVQDAQQSDARQKNDTLLLSSRAEMDSKPQLEIFADDVQCSHGATTGQLDEDSLFYLKSRGLGDKQARAVLIRAFLMDLLEDIDIQALRHSLTQQFDRHLDQYFQPDAAAPG